MFSELLIEKWVVIIADDEPERILVAKTLLAYYGARVHIAANGTELLDLLSVIRPTFVLLDLTLPLINDRPLVDEIRQRSYYNPLTLIGYSANPAISQREAAFAAGFDEYMSLPFKFKTFLEDIHASLERIDQRQRQVSLVSG